MADGIGGSQRHGQEVSPVTIRTKLLRADAAQGQCQRQGIHHRRDKEDL